MALKEFYPDPILNLPRIDIPFEGIAGRLLQGTESQVVFFELGQGTEVPAHSHEAQWGIVLEGEIEMVIGDETKVFAAGECYFIPEGVVHSGRPVTDCKALDVFFTPDRYKARK